MCLAVRPQMREVAERQGGPEAPQVPVGTPGRESDSTVSVRINVA